MMNYREYYTIGAKTYMLRYWSGIHEVVDYETGDTIFEGHYEDCRAYVKNLKNEYEESRI